MRAYKRHRLRITIITHFLVGLLVAPFGSLSDVSAQGVPTATPDADGVIYVEVLPNDSLWRIASQAGITLQELMALNDLSENTIIHPGQRLIIGYGTPPPTPTLELPTATATATRPPPTATATPLPPPRTAICLVAFDDLNKDGIRDDEEPLKTAVAFTIFNDESVVGNYISDGESEPYCLEGLTPGAYKITRSIGRDETLTTDGDWALTLSRGTTLNLEFGSFIGAAPANTVTSSSLRATLSIAEDEATPGITGAVANESDSSGVTLIGITILIVLLLGAGLLLAFRRYKSSAQ